MAMIWWGFFPTREDLLGAAHHHLYFNALLYALDATPDALSCAMAQLATRSAARSVSPGSDVPRLARIATSVWQVPYLYTCWQPRRQISSGGGTAVAGEITRY